MTRVRHLEDARRDRQLRIDSGDDPPASLGFKLTLIDLGREGVEEGKRPSPALRHLSMNLESTYGASREPLPLHLTMQLEGCGAQI